MTTYMFGAKRDPQGVGYWFMFIGGAYYIYHMVPIATVLVPSLFHTVQPLRDIPTYEMHGSDATQRPRFAAWDANYLIAIFAGWARSRVTAGVLRQRIGTGRRRCLLAAAYCRISACWRSLQRLL